jgi:outer membrane protein assembly factor BamB
LLYLEGPEVGNPAASPGATATATPSPSPDDERDAGSELVALDLGDLTERWRVPLEGVSRTGVTVDGDVAFVGDQGGTVYAVAIADGRVRWTANAGAKVDVPIAAADGRAIVVGRNAAELTILVNAFDGTDGTRAWRQTLTIGSSVVSAPALDDEGVILGLPDRFARAFGVDGEERWAALVLTVFSPVTSPALAPGSVFIADVGGGLYRLDPQDGGRTWSYQLNELVLRSSPVVSGETVLVGMNDGRLVAIDADGGHLVWESEATPGLIGTIALARDAVVAVKGGREAGLIAFEHDPAGALVDEPPPTELEPGVTLARFGVASLIVLGAFLVPGILLRRRYGDAFPPGVQDEEPEPEPAADGQEDA